MTTSAASVLRLNGLQFTSAEAQGGLEKNSNFSNSNFHSGARPTWLSRGKVPATRCEGPRGFISTLTRQFHAVVYHCDDSFMQAQGRSYLSWDPVFPTGRVSPSRQPNSSFVQRVLFSRPSFCSVFFLVIMLCHYCECLRACCMRMVVCLRALFLLVCVVWQGRWACVPVLFLPQP